MKYVLLGLLYFLLFSCVSSKAIRNHPLAGVYPAPPITFETTSKIEDVWSNIIDFVAQKGMTIKIIDRSSGLIILDDFSFAKLFTFENKEGKVNNPGAYLVSSWYYAPSFGKNSTPDQVLGNWNIRIKELDGKTVVNVNITNIRSIDFIVSNGIIQSTAGFYDIRTTGVFEKLIFNNIK